ncbi:zinc finger protein 540-like [Neocloeon triangulifer]|uniref:zinc finger protein 540-like n=1 Tax=Neocloeon triangulifer TaxID=2078957 RepID=UPI00286F77C7|nr:zinc finger protein 540-like [Neocloeon triangulifer]
MNLLNDQEVEFSIADWIGFQCNLELSNDPLDLHSPESSSRLNDSHAKEMDSSYFLRQRCAKEGSKELKCKFCNMKFRPSATESFLNHCTKTQCMACSEEFECAMKMTTHRRWHCPDFDENRPRRKYQNKKLWCDLCSRHLICRRKYLQEKHKTERKCKKCNLTFACCGLATAHKSGSNCEGGEKKKTLSSIPKEQNSCTHCKKNYKSERLHFEVKNRSCLICSKTFKCSGLRIKHQAECFFSCAFCGQTTKNKNQHGKHKRERRCPNCSHVSQCFNLFSQHECSETSDDLMEVPKNEPAEDEEIKIVHIRSLNLKEFHGELLTKCHFCQILCNSVENFECHTRQTDCPRCGFAQPCNNLLAQHLDLCQFEREEPANFYGFSVKRN